MKRNPIQIAKSEQGQEGQAFALLYEEYGERIYRFCYRLCGHAAEAEDLAQEVFVAAWKGLERFKGRSSVATWLYRIALYSWNNMRREGRSREIHTVSMEGIGEVLSASDPAEMGVERLTLDYALAMLSPELREAFLLVKVEGLKYREAAEALEIPQGTVQSRVHDAVFRLRGILEPGSEDSSLQTNASAADRRKEATIDAL